MKCLVTGGCGFIGSHIADKLIGLNHEVIVLDDLSTGKKENLNPHAQFVQGSILDFDLLMTLTKDVNWLFHLAAWARVQRSVEDPIGTHDVNVNGMLNLLEVARKNKVNKFIYSSSSSVYGDQPAHIMVEDMPHYPKSPYALQKSIGEQYATMYARLFDMKIASLRYFNVYGNRQITEGAYALVIGKFMRMKKDDQPLTVYGDGEQTRAYTYIDDVVRANILVAQSNISSGHNLTLNIGSSVETSVNDIAHKIGGKVKHIIPNPRGEFEERRKVADYSKAEATIGWKPLVSFEKGMKIVLETNR